MTTKDPEESTWETDGGAVPKSDFPDGIPSTDPSPNPDPSPDVPYACDLCGKSRALEASKDPLIYIHPICKACRAKRQTP
jgi:hypothetical protein